MIISEPARVTFVHVPKTGGSTVAALLSAHLPDPKRMAWLKGKKHATLDTLLRVRPQYTDHFTFGFVRNPWARMWSWHSMVMRRAAENPAAVAENPFWSRVAAEYTDFEKFVMEGPQRMERLNTPQIDYLRTPTRRADFIGRTESLEADLRSVTERVGLPADVTVTRTNVTPSVPYEDQYTQAMRDRVATVFAADVTEFGYTFERARR